MRRWALLVVISLAIGMIATICVCWQAAFWPSMTQVNWAVARNPPNDWITAPPARNPSVQYFEHSTTSDIATNRTVYIQFSFSTPKQTNYSVNSPPKSDWNYCIFHESFGWPMRAMYHELAFVNADGTGVMRPFELNSRREGISTGRHFAGRSRLSRAPPPYDELRLPIRVHPLGFVINTLLTGALCIFPFVLLRLRKAWIAQKRLQYGRCEACGYDLADLTTCPECGTPDPSKLTT